MVGKKGFDPEALLRAMHLRPRVKTEEEKRYGTFNRRMMAASIDSLLITAIIAPVVDMVFVHYYGAPTVTVQDISARAMAGGNSAEAMRMFLQEMESSGYLDRWTINLRWQMYVLSVYTIVCWHFWSATPGKMLCRLKVVDAKTGGRMGDMQSILRVLGYFLSAATLGLGFFWIGIDKKRRGWHDLLAGTVVVRSKL